MRFELYNINFICATGWRSYIEHNKVEILDDLTTDDASFYYVIDLGNAGCVVSSVSNEDYTPPLYSLSALILDITMSDNFSAYVAVNNDVYYLKVEDGIINQSSDRFLEGDELSVHIEGLNDSDGDIYIDIRLKSNFNDETADDNFTDFKSKIKAEAKNKKYKYTQLKGALPIVRYLYMGFLILGAVYFILWNFDLLHYIGLGSDKSKALVPVIAKTEAEKTAEKRELMKKEVARSLSIDTTASLPVDLYNSCQSLFINDVNSIGAWDKASSVCREKDYISSFVRSRGDATSSNFELIALSIFPERQILMNVGSASILTSNETLVHKPITRDFLPEKPILRRGRSFFETRKDYLLNVNFNDKGRKPLQIIYENVSYKVDDDLNYSSAIITLSKIPMYELKIIAEEYNTEYAKFNSITAVDRLVTAELTIYYR